MAAHLALVHLAVRRGKAQREKRRGHHLRRVGLGRGDADLGARLDVHRAVGLARRRGAEDVRDGEDLAAERPHATRRGEGVCGLARLGDDDAERVVGDERLLVVELGGVLAEDRDLRPVLHELAGDEAHVIGSAAGDHVDAVDGGQLLLGHVKLVEKDAVLAEAVLQEPTDGLGLLGDLLRHEV